MPEELETEIKFVPQRLYPQCYVIPDVERCLHCRYGHPVWFDGQDQLGWCDLTHASAYYTQLEGFCPKVLEQHKPLKIHVTNDHSTCQAVGCTNVATSWAVMAPKELIRSESPFITVGLCKRHLKVLERLSDKSGDKDHA